MNTKYDILIIGSGLTGLSLACALKNKPLRIGIIDGKPYQANKNKQIQDARSLALSFISQRIFQGLNLWEEIKKFAAPIKKIHISDQGHFGFSRINAIDQPVDALGHVVEIEKLMEIIDDQVKQSQIEFIVPAQVEHVVVNDEQAAVTLLHQDKEISLTSQLLVVADGGQSTVRQLLNIPIKKYDYQQTAVVANIGLERDHDFTAYERFTQSGPLALLPLAEKCYALVLTLQPAEAERVLALTEKEFLYYLQKAFGYRLGRFAWAGTRQAFPLHLVYAQQQTRQHTVIIGNACHTLHPIAGQGFNLGLRDVALLAQFINDDVENKRKLGVLSRLQAYGDLRARDHRQIIGLTDNLVKLFSNDYLPLVLLRNLGLLGLDVTKSKNLLARRTMGFNKHMPDLALGLPLN